MDQDTARTVLKSAGPVVGFLVRQANGMSGKGFVLGIALVCSAVSLQASSLASLVHNRTQKKEVP